ncbi:MULTISPECIES: helix-turn-helix domain-containing protein [Bacillus]|uniref:Helix-turn-helix transcriptional regulator n=1 Tax=Bacillus cabrialesii subsp. tritici TaxID=2944916 RepID=A0ABT9DP17_9BACI|nr:MULTISPECIES: helix-turn-helix transcriptional regulator [Bacillus]MDO8226443.1 helix-turn-helix transcriptional regulator [Bacillus cabrialesii subsp. tritici]MDP8527332.1 helix-turn-helix transcriptional regulator [Bacillus subtilis]MEC1634741.1 helix-turn-helix transcriptional regulator [Bacillus mojavensis]MEC1683689.1 helix-turn-helix transcriptional regulator [Bacillus mojavensis]NUF06671.1 helix-turn-helix transcriptional regulator [Bacillus rugosus]
MADFKDDVRKIRTQKKIGSRKLARLIGKAETYVSQLERGLIKKPDYHTCFAIMRELGFREERIEDILDEFYNIKSPEKLAEEERIAKEQARIEEEKLNDPDYLESQLTPHKEGDDELNEEEEKKYQEIYRAATLEMAQKDYVEEELKKPNPNSIYYIEEDFLEKAKLSIEKEFDQLKKEKFNLTITLIGSYLTYLYERNPIDIEDIAESFYELLNDQDNDNNLSFLKELLGFKYFHLNNSKREEIITAIHKIINQREDT